MMRCIMVSLKKSTYLWIMFILQIQMFNVIAIPDVLLDYCITDVFAADCPVGYIALMEEARYGRMQLGTCLNINIGFMGCSSDVISLMDKWCSGQQSCRFKVLNIVESVQPCPEEVTSYLQARYTCLKVMIPNDICCQTTQSNIINDAQNGVLASSIAVHTGCGYIGCPWIIQARMGQLLNISLYDFGTYNAGLFPSDWENDGGNHCRAYATINEMSVEGTIKICAGDARLKSVYTSISEVVQIQFMNNQQDETDHGSFLIGFEAIGCPDPDPPLNMYLQREGSQATIRCSSNGNTWHIECQGNTWQGDLDSCSNPTSTYSPGKPNIASFISGDVFIVFVAAVTFVISVAIITIGIVCYQRNRSRSSVTRRSKNDNTMWMMNRLDGAYAAQEFEYSGTTLPRDYHRENYIYYLTKQQVQDKILGTSSNTEREKDNGYYSDHTYESPRCEHMKLRRHSVSGDNQCDSDQFGPALRTPDICGTMHGDDVLFPRSKPENVGEECIRNKTV